MIIKISLILPSVQPLPNPVTLQRFAALTKGELSWEAKNGRATSFSIKFNTTMLSDLNLNLIKSYLEGYDISLLYIPQRSVKLVDGHWHRLSTTEFLKILEI